MIIRYLPDPAGYRRMDSQELRNYFLLDKLFTPNKCELVYCDSDRAIVGSAVPVDGPLSLGTSKELRSEYFAQMREIGVLNVGPNGKVVVDGEEYPLQKEDILYIGRGSRSIEFSSDDPKHPARFYIVSYPAHTSYPTTLVRKSDAHATELGTQDDANRRVLRKYIYPDGVKSCQLVMGVTSLLDGSVWNTMPAHTHARRSEVYVYFNMDDDSLVFHMMGQPDATRHIVIRNEQAVISPLWSIHSGVGTRRYTFAWAMGGENQEFSDMDEVNMQDMI